MTDTEIAQVETPDAPEAVEPDVIQEAEPEAPQQTDEDKPFPKKAVNAITRRDRQIGKYKAQLEDQNRRFAEMQRQIEELTQKSQPKAKEPNEADFDNYGDYLKALATFKPVDQTTEKVDPEKIQQEAFQKAQKQIYYNQRLEAVTQQAQKAMQEVPGLSQIIDEYSDVLDSFPPEIEMAFLEADNAPMAFYALAQDGKLEQLAQMTPTQAAMEIARAQIRGEQMAKASKVSKAPQPIQGVKPGGAGGKSLSDMSADELMKWQST